MEGRDDGWCMGVGHDPSFNGYAVYVVSETVQWVRKWKMFRFCYTSVVEIGNVPHGGTVSIDIEFFALKENWTNMMKNG